MNDRDELEKLIAARQPCVAVQTVEEEYVLTLLREIGVERGIDVWVWSVSIGLRDGLLSGADPIADTQHPAGALCHISNQTPKPGLFIMLDLAGHLKDERTLRLLRDVILGFERDRRNLVLIDHHMELPSVIRSTSMSFALSLPDEEELTAIVKTTLREENEESRIDCRLSQHELRMIVRNLRGLSRRQAQQVIRNVVCDDHRFDSDDVNRILVQKRKAIGDGLLEYIESPVTLDEVGGLVRLKDWLVRHCPSGSDEAAAFGLDSPRGILLLGVQGAGKSLAAKAVATAWRQPLLKMDAGSLYDRYIGESERRLRDALLQTERMAPVVLWIDEIEKGFASAASQSSDGGLSKRMFGALLSWMQERTAPVFLVATANDIEALPPELLRKGRFDEIFFVDLPNLEARAAIAGIHLTRRKRDPRNFDLGQIAEASAGYSGAEIEAGIVAALHLAFKDQSELTTSHITAALAGSPPALGHDGRGSRRIAQMGARQMRRCRLRL